MQFSLEGEGEEIVVAEIVGVGVGVGVVAQRVLFLSLLILYHQLKAITIITTMTEEL